MAFMVLLSQVQPEGLLREDAGLKDWEVFHSTTCFCIAFSYKLHLVNEKGWTGSIFRTRRGSTRSKEATYVLYLPEWQGVAEHVTEGEGKGALGLLAVEATTDFTAFLGILEETEDLAFVTFETVGEWQGLFLARLMIFKVRQSWGR
ncbi:uncharacterized protein CLUP02_12396 [Colletotrichum lupini]|uniref:Uncharacterized protein n=1 Tax=Colletotrichum lupini TaxID=145971 RepID=A0A9Q8T099_9PEZI|nr:uncharacterized protein CLUP02_12396 [Colletotrichum lupini]UQC86894.1 hypothetical protein CLUP02_12396 [Colletotrichum lupini]